MKKSTMKQQKQKTLSRAVVLILFALLAVPALAVAQTDVQSVNYERNIISTFVVYNSFGSTLSFITTDSHNNLFITDQTNNVIKKVDATSKAITIVAGTGTAGFSGDGAAATS